MLAMKDKSFYKDAPAYCHYFFDLVETGNLVLELEESKKLTQDFLSQVPVDKENYRYDENKWTIKEVVRHIIDCERVYVYRAFRFSRFDATELAGFDEDRYIDKVKSIHFSMADLLEEYLHLRNATISLYKTMSDEMLDFKGRANNANHTARTMGIMAVGHNLHHIQFIKNKYLQIQ